MLKRVDRTLTAFESWHIGMLGEMVPESARWIGVTGPAWSGFAGYDLIAIGGIALVHSGVGEAYIFGTPLIKENAVWFTKHVIDKLLTAQSEMKLHRVQCSVRASDKSALRWIRQKRFGFKYEGPLWKFGPDGSDYFRFARIV